MPVTVRPFGIVRAVLGQKSFLLDLSEEATVRDAVDQLTEMGGPEARNILLSPDGNSLKVRAVVDGKAASLDSLLRDGAELGLMLPIGGGA
jgi:molybdopterin converting factor small subunit